MDNERIGILGNGGQADEAESFLDNKKSVEFRAVDKQYIDQENSNDLIDIESPEDHHRELPVIAAIGAPAIRKFMIEKWPGERYESIISEHAVVDKSVKVGEGCMIAPRAVVTTNVEIGNHSLINVAASIQHNSVIGEFVTIGPGSHIAGNVVIGDGVFIGMGANVSNNIRIASGVVIGAGAVVIRNIEEENSIYVGVPAKKIGMNEDWLSEI